MEQIHNTTPIVEDTKPELKTSEFEVQDANHLILCVINAPVGKVKIDAAMTLSTKEKTSGVPLGFIMLKGTPQQIIEELLYGAGTILSNGLKKNSKNEKSIIVPEEKKLIIPRTN